MLSQKLFQLCVHDALAVFQGESSDARVGGDSSTVRDCLQRCTSTCQTCLCIDTPCSYTRAHCHVRSTIAVSSIRVCRLHPPEIVDTKATTTA
jgi:hypothetical protein